MCDGEIPGTMYGMSNSGWINGELFDQWFHYHFLPHAPASRPLLLLLDGHSSHFTPSVIRKAAEEQVVVFCLPPPYTTHETQPLDKGPLKSHWRKHAGNFCMIIWEKLLADLHFPRYLVKSAERLCVWIT